MTETHETDVLVVGAGASGAPAAIAAARNGSEVILLEQDPLPGGAAVNMYVGFLCGGPRTGIFLEMIGKLNAKHELSGEPIPGFTDGRDGRLHWYLPSSYVAVLFEIMGAEKRLHPVFGSRVSRVLVREEAGGRRVAGVVCTKPDGTEVRYEARVTIDATGDAAVADAAGCETRYGRESREEHGEPLAPAEADDRVQQCTWMYISQRIGQAPLFDMDRLSRRSALESNLGWWRDHREECLERNAGIYLHWGCAVQCRDTRDPAALADAQREAHEAMRGDLEMLRENGYAVHLAPKLGVRESRRIVGEYVLSTRDLKEGLMPEDTIATSDYSLDAWGQSMTREDAKLPLYGIPYRSLIPKGTEGLLVCGRCISGTHLAASSYRVQPCAAGIGQGAGTAAALAASGGLPVRDIPVKRLKEALVSAGALPREAVS